MTLGNKLSKLRKENNYTQEQLADVLGVSRQAISKWESDVAYPETDKLIRISKLFGCTIDYLLLEGEENKSSSSTEQEEKVNNHLPGNQIFIESPKMKKLVSCFKVTASPVIGSTKDQPQYLLLGVDKISIFGENTVQLGWYETEEEIQKEISEISNAIRNGEGCYTLKYNIMVDERFLISKDKEVEVSTAYPFQRTFIKERKSEKTLCGLPLWHIGKNAKGIVAVGLCARGIISVGLLSIGVLSFGLLSLGLLSLGVLTFGLISFGCFSVGVLAIGAISLGIVSMGAIAIGNFSAGALAIGKYVAIGDEARAMIAIGGTKAVGSEYEKIGKITSEERVIVKNAIDTLVPKVYSWAKEIIKLFL